MKTGQASRLMGEVSMSTEEKYPAFPKIPRLRRTIIVTEKIDGTNALVHVSDEGVVRAGSRTRWITPEKDNFGFAAWVLGNEEELRTLGPGYHYGEWWGQGIQRGYGLDSSKNQESYSIVRQHNHPDRRFSLFNTGRWSDDAKRPRCCHVVPVLGTHENSHDTIINYALGQLRTRGSVAAPGFMEPEGVVVYHTASGTYGKVLLENDDRPKGEAVAKSREERVSAAHKSVLERHKELFAKLGDGDTTT